MAARQTGAVRFRFFGPDCEKYVPLGRVLMGALLDRLTIGAGQARMRGEKPDYSGQQTQRLADGTFIRAIWDGTLPIVEIYTRGAQPEEECDVLPDIIGLAVTPWKEDVFEFTMEPDLPEDADTYSNAYTHAAIAGWKVHRPPVDSEMPEDRKRAWFDSTGEHLAEPRRFFDKVTSECGDLTKVHDHILMGNWDWTNGTDTLSCFAGTPYQYPHPSLGRTTAYYGTQRYGVPGIGTKIYFRGRQLVDVTNWPIAEGIGGGKVLGMALRHTERGTYLMAIVGNTNRFGVFKVPIRWLASELHPTVETVTNDHRLFSISSEMQGDDQKDSMWCWNASGTEARRIRNIQEEVVTEAGFTIARTANLGNYTNDTTVTNGSGVYTAHGLYHHGTRPEPFVPSGHLTTYTMIENSIAEPGVPVTEGYDSVQTNGPLLNPPSSYDARPVITVAGRTSQASGSGQLLLAVDYIGDTPEYWYADYSGGQLNQTMTAKLNPEIWTFEFETQSIDVYGPSVMANPTPPPDYIAFCDSSTITAPATAAFNHKMVGQRSYVMESIGPVVQMKTTTYGQVYELHRVLTENITAETVLWERFSSEHGPSMTHTSGICAGSANGDPSYVNSSLEREFSLSSLRTRNRHDRDLQLLYLDLRYGLVVYTEFDTTESLTTERSVPTMEYSYTTVYTSGAPFEAVETLPANTPLMETGGVTTTQTSRTVVLHKGVELQSYAHPDQNTNSSSSVVAATVRARFWLSTETEELSSGLQLLYRETFPEIVDVEPVDVLPEDYFDLPGASFVDTPPDTQVVPWRANTTPWTGYWFYPAALAQVGVYEVRLLWHPVGTHEPYLSVYFGATADDDGNLYFSMPLPVNGWSEDWETVNIFQGTEPLIPEVVGAPETYNFWPMTFIGPAFVSVPREEE